LTPLLNAARERLGELVYAEGDVSLEQATVSALAERGLTAACAESVTGGMIAHLITNVPGSSAVLLESAVTYHKAAKLRLGVKPDTLASHGTVSAQTTIEMAQAIAARSNANICVAVTGNAGPTLDQPTDNGCIVVAGPPPSEKTSVGTVFIAAVMGGEARAWRLQVPGDRELVKWRTARSALNALRMAAIHGKLPEQIAQWVTPP
jgi:nicotinamide-nucleotide amidase